MAGWCQRGFVRRGGLIWIYYFGYSYLLYALVPYQKLREDNKNVYNGID